MGAFHLRRLLLGLTGEAAVPATLETSAPGETVVLANETGDEIVDEHGDTIVLRTA